MWFFCQFKTDTKEKINYLIRSSSYTKCEEGCFDISEGLDIHFEKITKKVINNYLFPIEDIDDCYFYELKVVTNIEDDKGKIRKFTEVFVIKSKDIPHAMAQLDDYIKAKSSIAHDYNIELIKDLKVHDVIRDYDK